MSNKLKTLTFSFSKEEMDFLRPRQAAMNFYQVAVSDIDFAMSRFVDLKAVPRIAVDPKLYTITYDVVGGTLIAEPKPEEPKVEEKKDEK